MIITTEEFRVQSRKDLCLRALKILSKHYKGYVWGACPTGLTTITISEAKLLQWGGAVQTYHIHDNAWSNLNEFEALVKKFGGELLERSLQSRIRNNGLPVDKLPEGFNPRLAYNTKVSKIKLVGPNGQDIEQYKADRLAVRGRELVL